MGQVITFQRPDGGSTAGYLARAQTPKGNVVIIQEWWGLNDHIRQVADRFAEIGFNALAPDLFKGRVTRDSAEASHLMNHLDFPDATHQDIRGAVDYLRALGGNVGVTGFCMGGALTIAAAVHVPDISAAVCFYGVPPAAFASPADIAIPFQGHFANRDDWVTPAIVNNIEAAMKNAPHKPEIFRYEADHAFFNNTRPEVFDPKATSLAWARTLQFFEKNLA
jgi:carboxymethylenebutenolidase